MGANGRASHSPTRPPESLLTNPGQEQGPGDSSRPRSRAPSLGSSPLGACSTSCRVTLRRPPRPPTSATCPQEPPQRLRQALAETQARSPASQAGPEETRLERAPRGGRAASWQPPWSRPRAHGSTHMVVSSCSARINSQAPGLSFAEFPPPLLPSSSPSSSPHLPSPPPLRISLRPFWKGPPMPAPVPQESFLPAGILNNPRLSRHCHVPWSFLAVSLPVI